MPGVIDVGEYSAFVRRRVPRDSGSFFAGGDGVGRFLSTDSTMGDGHASGYSPMYDTPQWPTSAVGRFAHFMQRGHMFRPFTLPVHQGNPINAQFPLVDGVDLGSIRRRVPGGKLGVPQRATMAKGREAPVWIDRAVWARRPPQSLTARVIR